MGSGNGRFLAYYADLHVLPSMNLELNKNLFCILYTCTLIPLEHFCHLYSGTLKPVLIQTTQNNPNFKMIAQ